jgi:hypothetical protein
VWAAIFSQVEGVDRDARHGIGLVRDLCTLRGVAPDAVLRGLALVEKRIARLPAGRD